MPPVGLDDFQPQRPAAAAEQQRPPLGANVSGLHTDVDRARPQHAQPTSARDLQVGADLGRQRADDAGQLDGGARGVEAALGRRDLLGVGRPLLALLFELQPAFGAQVQGPDQQLATERRQLGGEHREVILRADCHLLLQGKGARVKAGADAHHTDTGAAVSGHDRPLDRRCAAPTGQQRGMHVQHRQLREQRLAEQLPEGANGSRLSLDGADSLAAPPPR